MKFIVRNQTIISNKYIRVAMWKIRKLSRKFEDVLSAEIYVKKVSTNPEINKAVINLGIPGPDLIVSTESNNLNDLWAELLSKINRQLRKYSSKKK